MTGRFERPESYYTCERWLTGAVQINDRRIEGARLQTSPAFVKSSVRGRLVRQATRGKVSHITNVRPASRAAKMSLDSFAVIGYCAPALQVQFYRRDPQSR